MLAALAVVLVLRAMLAVLVAVILGAASVVRMLVSAVDLQVPRMQVLAAGLGLVTLVVGSAEALGLGRSD